MVGSAAEAWRRNPARRSLIRQSRGGGRVLRGRLATGAEWWRPLPPGASADARRILAARGLRGFGDGFVGLLLPIYLIERGFSALAVGAIVTGTLIGTALMTLSVGWI